MRKRLAPVVAALVAVAACGSDSDESSADVEAGADVEASSDVETSADVTVTFDGESCTIEAPETLDPGQNTFLFIDEADRSGEMWVRQLVDGATWDDVVEYMEEQGGPGVYFPKPEWLVAVPQYAPAEQPAEGQYLYSHDLPADSVFSFTIGAEDDAGTTAEAIWLCGPIRT